MVGVAVWLGVSALAQPIVVTGRGDLDIDIPAVQAAVDQGGHIVLAGHFSFNRPPTTPAGATYARTVTVSKYAVIAGRRDANGDLASIEVGEWPFFVDAVDSHVSFHELHFLGPRGGSDSDQCGPGPHHHWLPGGEDRTNSTKQWDAVKQYVLHE